MEHFVPRLSSWAYRQGLDLDQDTEPLLPLVGPCPKNCLQYSTMRIVNQLALWKEETRHK